MNETKSVELEEELMSIKNVRVPSSPQDVHPNQPGDASVHLETQNLHVWFGKRLILEKVNLEDLKDVASGSDLSQTSLI